MAVVEIVWPKKTRDVQHHYIDSTVWDDVVFRDNDTVVCTWGKCGTTWTQQILLQLQHGPDPCLSIQTMSPWVDRRSPPRPVMQQTVENLKSPRVLKSHLAVDAIVFSPKAKYVYIARDARDLVWSWHSHWAMGNEKWYTALNESFDGPPFERAPATPLEAWAFFMNKNGYPLWPFWEHIRGWWEVRHLPNVLLLHFNDLKKDPAAQIARLAAFVGADSDPARLAKVMEYSSFDFMKTNANIIFADIFWEGGASSFFRAGSNGRWTDTLPAEESTRYEAAAVAELGAECAQWLAHGSA